MAIDTDIDWVPDAFETRVTRGLAIVFLVAVLPSAILQGIDNVKKEFFSAEATQFIPVTDTTSNISYDIKNP